MFKKCFYYPTNIYVLAKFWYISYLIKISGERLCPPHPKMQPILLVSLSISNMITVVEYSFRETKFGRFKHKYNRLKILEKQCHLTLES